MNSNRKLPLKSLSSLTALKLAAAVIGLFQTIMIAWCFGATRTVEVFFAAMTFQQLLLQLTSSGQIGDLFTPIYHDIKTQYGSEPARRAFSAMTNVMLLGGTLIAIVAVALAKPISAAMVPGFSTQDVDLTTKVFTLVAPVIVVMIGNAMYANLLRAEHRYGVSESLAVVSKLVNLIVLICLARSFGVWSLIIGIWISAFILLVGQTYYAFRVGIRYAPVLRTDSFHPRTVLIKLPLAFTHIISSQFFAFALTAGLSLLPEGSLAAYSYAQRLRSKFQGMVLQPIGVVFFNHFSESLSKGVSTVRSYAEHALALSIGTIAFCVVPILAGGDLLLSGLWGGKTFSPDRISQAYWILCALTALLAFNAQYLIARRTNLALKIVGHQFAASGCVLLLSGLACKPLIEQFGLVGAVIIQGISALLNAGASLGVLAWHRRELVALIPLNRSLQWTLASGISVCLAWLVRSIVTEDVSTGIPALMAGLVTAFISWVFLFATSSIMRIPEACEIRDKLWRNLPKYFGISCT